MSSALRASAIQIYEWRVTRSFSITYYDLLFTRVRHARERRQAELYNKTDLYTRRQLGT